MAWMSRGAMRNSQGCHTLGHFRDSAGEGIKKKPDGLVLGVLYFHFNYVATDWQTSLLKLEGIFFSHVCVCLCEKALHMGASLRMQVRKHVWRPKTNCLRNSGVLFPLRLETWNSGAADATGLLHFPNTGVKSVHYDAWLFKWLSGIDLRPSCVCNTQFTHWTIHSESRADLKNPFNI